MIDVIYFDKDICVCHKPRGILSEGQGQRDMPLSLAAELEKKGLSATVFTVHRLDRETEGLMVYALNSAAAAELSRQLREGELKKEYIAELCGIPQKTEAELCDLLFYDRQRGKSFVVDKKRNGVRDARLFYRVTETENGYSRVRVKLYTGRTHQIRVQFASRGLPLRGDRRYGAPKDSGDFSLRSCYLSFKHPSTGEFLEFGDRYEHPTPHQSPYGDSFPSRGSLK